jgi:phosphatidylserine/phosphatidylglycerophosphate/cardiolipin synthase-like enzyme
MTQTSLLSLARIDTDRLEQLWRVLGALPAKHRVSERDLGADDLVDVLEPLLGQAAWVVASMLEAVLAERGSFKPAVNNQQQVVEYKIERHYGDSSPELVWSGDMASRSTARMTRWVIEDLFRSASQHVLIAGYSFDGAKDLFAPLFDRAEKLAAEQLPLPQVRVILDCSRVKVDSASTDPTAIARMAGQRFKSTCWTGATLPAELLYYLPSTMREPSHVPGRPAFAPNSMHAKCIIVDGTTALVGSANFSSRGRENRANVEVGALIRDHHFVQSLLAAWTGIEDELRPVPA